MASKVNKKTTRYNLNVRIPERMPVCVHGSGSAVYGLGFLGALIYYLTTATSVWAGIVGVLKALVWPAFLVFELMKYLGM